MKKNITFAIISHSGCKIRKITASGKAISIAGFSAVFSLLLLITFIVSYMNLRVKASDTQTLNRMVALQRQQIQDYRKQIQTFAEEINTLKTTLTELNNFEKKIRIIANIETNDDQTPVFGVGGSSFDDIDTDSMQPNTLSEMHEQGNIVTIASTKQHMIFSDLLKKLEKKADLLASTPSIYPTNGWIRSAFGYRDASFTNDKEFHQGIDIDAPKDTEVVATADGIITFTGTRGLLGKTIIIDHGYGVVTRYGHLYKILKENGEQVKRGDVIAIIGTSGQSKENHLYYEVRLNGIPVNPEKYMDMSVARFVTGHKAS